MLLLIVFLSAYANIVKNIHNAFNLFESLLCLEFYWDDNIILWLI